MVDRVHSHRATVFMPSVNEREQPLQCGLLVTDKLGETHKVNEAAVERGRLREKVDDFRLRHCESVIGGQRLERLQRDMAVCSWSGQHCKSLQQGFERQHAIHPLTVMTVSLEEFS